MHSSTPLFRWPVCETIVRRLPIRYLGESGLGRAVDGLEAQSRAAVLWLWLDYKFAPDGQIRSDCRWIVGTENFDLHYPRLFLTSALLFLDARTPLLCSALVQVPTLVFRHLA